MADAAKPEPARPRGYAVSHPEPPLRRPEHVRHQSYATNQDPNRSDRHGRLRPGASPVRATPPRRAATTARDREARAALAAGGVYCRRNRVPIDLIDPRFGGVREICDRQQPNGAGTQRVDHERMGIHVPQHVFATRESDRSCRPIRTAETGESNRHSRAVRRRAFAPAARDAARS